MTELKPANEPPRSVVFSKKKNLYLGVKEARELQLQKGEKKLLTHAQIDRVLTREIRCTLLVRKRASKRRRSFKSSIVVEFENKFNLHGIDKNTVKLYKTQILQTYQSLALRTL